MVEILIFRNLTYGDLDEDLEFIKEFESYLKNYENDIFPTIVMSAKHVKDTLNAMNNIVSALEKYKNMYHKEYIHHMDYKENLSKAERRATHYENYARELEEKLISYGDIVKEYRRKMESDL